jgi:uncharacterized alkaline shock family protein YloU
MEIIVLVGNSGTGKSYQAMSLAKKKNIEYIIDDGLLIKGNKVLGGFSAKREKSKMAAVKRALFINPQHKEEIENILSLEKPKGILILGTSEKMVEAIVRTFNLGKITERYFISDISTEEEIRLAQKYRKHEGKHVIPVPTFEIKKDFSGYFLNPLRVFRKFNKEDYLEVDEKSVVRPTYSYLGKYTISDKVIRDLILYASKKAIGIYKISDVELQITSSGVVADIEVVVVYGNPVKTVVEGVQELVKSEVERMTSLNILAVNIYVKSLIILE